MRAVAMVLLCLPKLLWASDVVMLKCDYQEVTSFDDVVSDADASVYYRIAVSGKHQGDFYVFDRKAGEWNPFKTKIDIDKGAFDYSSSSSIWNIVISRKSGRYMKWDDSMTVRYKGVCAPTDTAPEVKANLF